MSINDNLEQQANSLLEGTDDLTEEESVLQSEDLIEDEDEELEEPDATEGPEEVSGTDEPADDGDEEAEPPAEDSEETEDAPGVEGNPFAAVLERGRSLGLNDDAIVNGADSYLTLVEKMESGPGGAREVLGNLNKYAADKYGREFAINETDADETLDDLSDDDLTENEQALLRMNRKLANKLNTIQSEFSDKLKQLQPAVKAAESQSRMGVAYKKLKSAIPAADLSPEGVVRLMDKHGVDDPVKAYKLEAYDRRTNPSSAKAGGQARPRSAATTSAQKTFDPQDPSINADKIAFYMSKGYVPKRSKNGRAKG